MRHRPGRLSPKSGSVLREGVGAGAAAGFFPAGLGSGATGRGRGAELDAVSVGAGATAVGTAVIGTAAVGGGSLGGTDAAMGGAALGLDESVMVGLSPPERQVRKITAPPTAASTTNPIPSAPPRRARPVTFAVTVARMVAVSLSRPTVLDVLSFHS